MLTYGVNQAELAVAPIILSFQEAFRGLARLVLSRALERRGMAEPRSSATLTFQADEY